MNRIFKNRIVIATISLMLAIILGIVFYVSVNSSVETTSAIRLKENVTKGTEIAENMIESIQVSTYNLGDVMTDTNDVVGKFATIDMLSGDLVLRNKISADDTNEDRLSQLNGSKSAISVTIKNFADGLSDKLESGDIIFCIITDEKGVTATPKELNYVEVVAVTDKKGNDKAGETKKDDSENMATVTLLAMPKQAELLAKYDTSADIHMALVYRGNSEIAKKFIDEQDKILMQGSDAS